MRLATGFWAALASAAFCASSDSAGLVCPCPAADADALSGVEGGSCANANMPGEKINESDSNKIRLVNRGSFLWRRDMGLFSISCHREHGDFVPSWHL